MKVPGSILLFLLSLFSVTAESRVEYPEFEISVETAVPVPEVLYHWTRYKNLISIAANQPVDGEWRDFGSPQRSSYISGIFPDLLKNPYGLLFTWVNPVTAIKGGPGELYGSALTRLEISPHANVAHLEIGPRMAKGPISLAQVNLKNVDILVVDGFVKEVVILNPKIISHFTADPEVLRPDLEIYLNRLKLPKNKFSQEETHLYDFDSRPLFNNRVSISDRIEFRDYAIKTIERFLNEGSHLIPSFFKRDLNGLARTTDKTSTETLKNRLREWQKLEEIRNLEHQSLSRLAHLNEITEGGLSEEDRWVRIGLQIYLAEGEIVRSRLQKAIKNYLASLDVKALIPTVRSFPKAIISKYKPGLSKAFVREFSDRLTSGPYYLPETQMDLKSCAEIFSKFHR